MAPPGYSAAAAAGRARCRALREGLRRRAFGRIRIGIQRGSGAGGGSGREIADNLGARLPGGAGCWRPDPGAGHRGAGERAPPRRAGDTAARRREARLRPRHQPRPGAGPGDRRLHARLPRRWRRTAGGRARLAGHAAVARARLGASAAGGLPRAPRRDRRATGGLAGLADRRHGAAARRADADRARLAPARDRGRHLADPDARPPAQPGRARRDAGARSGAAGRLRYRPQGVAAGRPRTPRNRGEEPGRRADFRQPGDQARVMPRGGGRSRLAAADPAVVGAPAALPPAPFLSDLRPRMRQPGAAAARRRLQRTRLVVHPAGAAPQTRAAGAAAARVAAAARLRRAGRAVVANPRLIPPEHKTRVLHRYSCVLSEQVEAFVLCELNREPAERPLPFCDRQYTDDARDQDRILGCAQLPQADVGQANPRGLIEVPKIRRVWRIVVTVARELDGGGEGVSVPIWKAATLVNPDQVRYGGEGRVTDIALMM